MDQHRQRAVFEIERAHVEPSRIGRAGQHRAEPRFGLAMAPERRSGAPLPAARFEGEESVDPRVERLACPPAAKADRALFGKPVRLAAQFLALLRAHRGIPIIVRRSEEHTSELQSLMRISYAVFCLK